MGYFLLQNHLKHKSQNKLLHNRSLSYECCCFIFLSLHFLIRTKPLKTTTSATETNNPQSISMRTFRSKHRSVVMKNVPVLKRETYTIHKKKLTNWAHMHNQPKKSLIIRTFFSHNCIKYDCEEVTLRVPEKWKLLDFHLGHHLFPFSQTVFDLLIEMLKSSLWSTSPKSD